MVSNREVMMVGKMVVVVDGSHSMSCLSLPLARAKHTQWDVIGVCVL